MHADFNPFGGFDALQVVQKAVSFPAIDRVQSAQYPNLISCLGNFLMSFSGLFRFRSLSALIGLLVSGAVFAGQQQTGAASRAATDAAPAAIVEFYNTTLDNYFITADSAEAAAIDNGSAGPGWVRTGYTFKSGGDAAVCRFYGSLSPGPNSHFYTASGTECDGLKALQASTPATQKRWNFESLDFLSSLPVNGGCANGMVPVLRAYNNGPSRGLDSNHRITINASAIQEVVAQGWVSEGVVMCAPAGSGAATVFAVTPDRLMFGKSTRFTVTGQNLDQGITLAAPACAGITELPGGSAAQKVFACTPLVAGMLPLTVKAADGSTLLSAAQSVPAPQVSLKTSLGDILIELYPGSAPLTVRNFLQYVNDGFYKDKIFHRVINNFMIQTGGFNAAMQLAPTRPPIPLEVGLSNVRATVAMARYAAFDSADSQFFINVVDNIHLDTVGGGYAVFGKVVDGMAVADVIKAVPTQPFNGYFDVPTTPIFILLATQTQ